MYVRKYPEGVGAFRIAFGTCTQPLFPEELQTSLAFGVALKTG
jgi:hypothetical protein